MEILETQERKMNKNKEKKRELTHFLGHYRTFPYKCKGVCTTNWIERLK